MDAFSKTVPYKTPMLLSSRYFDVTNEGVTPLRTVMDYELEYNLRGGRTMILDGKSYDMAPGTHVLRRPGQYVCSKGDFKCYGIKVDFSWRPTMEGENRFHSLVMQKNYDSYMWNAIPSIFIPHHQEDIHRIYSRLVGISTPDLNEDPAVPSLLAELFHLLVADGLRERGTNSRNSQSPMEAVCSFIQLNYRQEMTLDDLADLVHLNKNHFARRFKQQMGVAPIEYLITIRLKNARDLLLGTQYSIKSIAFDCGFKNQSYFNYAFKKQFGVTPGEYRANVIQRESGQMGQS